MSRPAAADVPGTGHHRTPVDGPILSNQEDSFAWGVLTHRHPALIDQVRRAHPYGPRQLAHLDALHEEITSGPITALPASAHDHATWQRWGTPRLGQRPYFGQSWFDVPFLWAESYFYRRLLDAVDYYTAGPWSGVDPFEPAKAQELAEIGELERPTDRQALLLASLWGNRADLGFRAGTAARVGPQGVGKSLVRGDDAGLGQGHAAPSIEALVADDSARIWEHLAACDPGQVIVVADNAGRELLADLLLIDHLLATYAAEQVILHLKPAPYYVSDATTADASACLRALAARVGAETKAVAQRLAQAAAAGALVIATHPFYCAPLPFHDLPTDLAEQYAAARLVLLKGDLNYRRLVGDTPQPATSGFQEATGYFPAPVATLRTMKSEVVIGVDPGTQARLDASGSSWRTAGTHALIQLRP
jgi:hypothetical protein